MPAAASSALASINSKYCYGTKKECPTSSVMLLYISTGKGVSVKKEISFIIDATKQKLLEHSISTVYVSADTANHPWNFLQSLGWNPQQPSSIQKLYYEN